MATATPYGASADPYAPQVADAVRRRLQQGASPDPAVPATGTTDLSAPVPSAPFASPTTPAPPPTAPPPAPTPPPAAAAPPTGSGPYTPSTTDVPAPGNDANQIAGWFSTFLGRPATNDDMAFWLNQAKVNTGGLGWVRTQIANSPEALNYAYRPGGQFNPTTPAVSGPAPVPGGTASVTAPPTSSFTDSLRALLMQRLQAASAPVDENSPEIQASLTAARNEGTRAGEQERTALAERLYAQGGLNTNALTQQIQQSGEKQAASIGGLRATLLMNAYNQKRQELESDLQLAFSSGDAESARAIQIQIANLMATVQREGIGAGLAINATNQNANTVTAGG